MVADTLSSSHGSPEMRACLIDVQCWSRKILANFQALYRLVQAFQRLANQSVVLLHSGDNQKCPCGLVSTSRRLAYQFLAIAAIMLYLRVIFEFQRFGSRSRPVKKKQTLIQTNFDINRHLSFKFEKLRYKQRAEIVNVASVDSSCGVVCLSRKCKEYVLAQILKDHIRWNI